MKGYTGKVLIVDLNNRTNSILDIEDEIYEKFLSGAGLGAWYLYNNIPKDAAPLSQDNILAFTTGLLTGVGSVLTGRYMVMCKSPLTGGIGEANCGGYMAAAIKQCGYDAIFIHGISSDWVYLYINNNKVEIRDAKRLVGLDSVETENNLIETCKVNGKAPAVACIGQAGENLSLISGICTDRGRIAARSGVGAVMGSKKIKAVVCVGTKSISGKNPTVIKGYSKSLSTNIKKLNMPLFVRPQAFSLIKLMPPYVVPLNGMLSAIIMKKWGTAGTSSMCIVTGDSPIKNWIGSVKDFRYSKYRKIDGHNMLKKQTRRYHCYSCVLGCGGECDISNVYDGRYKTTHRPEYETQMSYGGLLLNHNIDSIFYLNEVLNRAGMDSISAGHCVAMAIECYKNGLLSKEDLNGIDLGWGKSEGIIEFTKMMIDRRGIGDTFADGTKVAASKLGKGADFAINVGGQEAAMHDGRGDPPLAIQYCVDATPGRHTTGSSQYYSVAHLWKRVSWAPALGFMPKSKEYIPSKEEAAKAVAMSYYKRIVDSTGACFFGVLFGVENFKLFEWLNATTNWSLSPDEYMVIGKRIFTLRQLFNIKHNIKPKNFRLPPRLAGEPPLSRGPLKGKSLKIDDMMREFWQFCGWDENGIPYEKTIEELSLNDL